MFKSNNSFLNVFINLNFFVCLLIILYKKYMINTLKLVTSFQDPHFVCTAESSYLIFQSQQIK